MFINQTILNTNFKHWIWQDRENKRLIIFSLILIVISFAWIKILYPFPNFIPPDSYNYLDAAFKNDNISIWPIGYSKFLRLVRLFTSSHFNLITLQYLTLQIAMLYLLFTFRYLIGPGKWIFRVMVIVGISNPLLAHIANFVSSDCLFISLSLIWFTQLLWIIKQPTKKRFWIHSIILLMAFTVRYTSIWYPLFSITTIISCKISAKLKWIGIGSILIPLLFFIGSTQQEYKKITNTVQYSAFGGWQLAANALYGYAYAKLDDPSAVPPKYKDLHFLVNSHMSALRRLPHSRRPDKDVAIYYLWNFKSPLRVFMNKRWENDKKTTFFTKWASMGTLYYAYGRWLIYKHPNQFIKHYLWPNLVRFYEPPANFMSMYNLGSNRVNNIAAIWFDWSNNLLPTRTKSTHIFATRIFTSLSAILNPLFLLLGLISMNSFYFKKCNSITKHITKFVLLFWLNNIIFSVFSAPIELRYQIFPLIITILFCLLFISFITQSIHTSTMKKHKVLAAEPI